MDSDPGLFLDMFNEGRYEGKRKFYCPAKNTTNLLLNYIHLASKSSKTPEAEFEDSTLSVFHDVGFCSNKQGGYTT